MIMKSTQRGATRARTPARPAGAPACEANVNGRGGRIGGEWRAFPHPRRRAESGRKTHRDIVVLNVASDQVDLVDTERAFHPKGNRKSCRKHFSSPVHGNLLQDSPPVRPQTKARRPNPVGHPPGPQRPERGLRQPQGYDEQRHACVHGTKSHAPRHGRIAERPSGNARLLGDSYPWKRDVPRS